MQGHQEYQEKLFSSINLASMVPKNHLLMKIDKFLDFSFIRELTQWKINFQKQKKLLKNKKKHEGLNLPDMKDLDLINGNK